MTTLVGQAVSAATISAVAPALDSSVMAAFHRQPLSDDSCSTGLDVVRVPLRLVGKVHRPVGLGVCGLTATGRAMPD